MKIVKIESKDIPIIQPMWEELNKLHGQLSTHFNEHFKSFTFQNRMNETDQKDAIAVFVIKEGSKLGGYCMASVECGIGEVDSIYIKPEYRGNKMGVCLIEKVETWLKSKEVTKIQISIVEGNEAVLDFYNRQGYRHKTTVVEKNSI